MSSFAGDLKDINPQSRKPPKLRHLAGFGRQQFFGLGPLVAKGPPELRPGFTKKRFFVVAMSGSLEKVRKGRFPPFGFVLPDLGSGRLLQCSFSAFLFF